MKTDSKQASQADLPGTMRLSSGQCAELFQLSPDAVCVVVRDRIVFANPHAVDFLGAATGSQIAELPISRFLASDSIPLSKERMRVMTQARRKLPSFIQTLKRLDLKEIDAEISARPVELDGSWGVLLTLRDVSDRARVIEALQRSRAALRQLSVDREAETRTLPPARAMIEQIAAGAPLQEILNEACECIERSLPGSLAVILRLGSDGSSLGLLAGPRWPEASGVLLQEAAFTVEQWPTGNVVRGKVPVVVPDLSAAQHASKLPEAVRNTGMQACWSVPVVLRSAKTVGALSVLLAKAGKPSAVDLELLHIIAQLVSIVIERSRLDAELQSKEALYRSAVSNLAEGVLVLGGDNIVTAANAAARRLFQVPGGLNPVGRPVFELVRSFTDSNGVAISASQCPWVRAGAADKAIIGELIGITRLDQSLAWLSFNAVPIPGQDKNARGATLVTFEDVSKVREQQQELMFLSRHDPLTKLPNRTMLREHLTEAISRCRRNGTVLAVMFLDLNRFKSVNARLGHDGGDAMLVEFTRRVRACLTGTDFLARQSGDEFAIIVEQPKNAEAVTKLAERIVRALSQSFLVDDQHVVLEVSIGISLFPVDGQDPEMLFRGARTAMHAAKARGRNHFEYFHREIGENTQQRVSLQSAVREAIEHGEFFLEYQPRANLVTGENVGVEALVLWRDDSGHIRSPAEFLPAAEASSLILPLTDWMLRESAVQAADWQRAGYAPLTLSVKLRNTVLVDPAFPNRLQQVLDKAGLSANYLEIEITEDSLVQDPDALVATLADLHAMGVSITVDDFGRGYSSLVHLQNFPLSKLKIDRYFTKRVPDDADASAITKGMVALARELRLKTVAEGVETPAQLDFMKAAGCDEYVGAQLGLGLVAADFEERWLQSTSIFS